jgi:hypothetical protein
MCESRHVLKRRAPRLVVTGFLLAVSVSGLSACRTSPNVAAYVGDDTVTVGELDAAVHQRLTDPDIAAYAKGKKDEFTRRVLSLLVEKEVYTAAAERYDLQIGNDEVRARIDELLGSDDADTVYAQLAQQQGVSRQDVFESVRQQIVRLDIAEAEGKADALDEPALRAAYEKASQNPTTIRLGYIDAPDQAAAAAVLDQLTASPANYPAMAALYPGQYTLPEVEERAPEQIPGPLAQLAAAAAPGTGFFVTVPEVPGVIVGFVAPYPSFEEARPGLEQQAADEVQQAAVPLVDKVRDGLRVRVNPRFGVLDDGQLKPDDSGVVDILGSKDTAAG